MNIHTASRIVAASLGTIALTGVTTLSFADTTPGIDDIEVTVDIAEITTPGVLAMSVATNSAALTEVDSDTTARVFTGTLPTVTITDTRDAADIPDGAYWYVLGSASAFTSGTNTIGAENLGWTPRLIDGGDSGLVAEGDAVGTALDDNGPGLVNQELLAMAQDSAAINTEGSWTADADLVLKTAPTVTPGSYTSTITLSLFE